MLSREHILLIYWSEHCTADYFASFPSVKKLFFVRIDEKQKVFTKHCSSLYCEVPSFNFPCAGKGQNSLRWFAFHARVRDLFSTIMMTPFNIEWPRVTCRARNSRTHCGPRGCLNYYPLNVWITFVTPIKEGGQARTIVTSFCFNSKAGKDSGEAKKAKGGTGISSTIESSATTMIATTIAMISVVVAASLAIVATSSTTAVETMTVANSMTRKIPTTKSPVILDPFGSSRLQHSYVIHVYFWAPSP